MLTNIVPSEYKVETYYGLQFFVDRGGGCEFPCDKDGNVIMKDMTQEGIDNYHHCLEHPEKFPYAFNKVAKLTWRYKEPSHGTCHCGERVDLINEYMGACQCPRCGQWYNLFGQELKDPTEWEMDDDENW